MQSLGVHRLPTIHSTKAIMMRLQNEYSVKTIRCQGALGHVYYVNDIACLISQVIYYFALHQLSNIYKGDGKPSSAPSPTILP